MGPMPPPLPDDDDALTDEELILRCRDAEPAVVRRSLDALAVRYHRKLAAYVFRITGDREAAEDVVQEAFIRVYRHAAEYRSVAKFSTWLYRIATNLALNEVRNRGYRPSLALNRPAGAEGGGTELIERVPDRGPGPAALAESRDLAQLVRDAVWEVQEPFRLVLVLCDLEQMSYAEAAATLDINIGTVRSRLSRARAQLQRLLAPLLEEMSD